MKRELDHLGRFLHMARDYGRKQGFKGTFYIEPKPMEPTKHQYDYDAATVIGFLRQYGLDHDFKLNLETNHATLAGHTFQHELQVAADAACWAASTPTAATTRTAGTPTSSPTTYSN
jgi:xylose isomerase